MELTTQERSRMRSALLKAGQRTRGMADSELIAAYESQNAETPEYEALPENAAETPECEALPEKAAATPEETEAAIKSGIEKAKKQGGQDMTQQAPQTDTINQIAQLLASMQAPAPQAPAFDEDQLIELIKKHGTMSLEVTPSPERDPIRIEGAHYQLDTLVTWLSTGTNVYLVGPAGSGKTTLAQQAAKALDRPFYSTGAIMASYELLGVRTAHGDYISTAMRQAFEHGGVFLWDEIDGSSAKALVCFNQLLANDRFTFPDGEVKKHPDFVAVAAANTVGQGANRQYIGRNQIDGATLDRFVQVDIGYDEKLEHRLAQAEYEAHGGTDTQALDSWVSKVQKVRKQLNDINATAIISPRASIFGSRGLAKGLSAESLTAQVLTKHLTEDQRSQIGHV